MYVFPLSLMMVIFSGSWCSSKKCHIESEKVERVLVKAYSDGTRVYINDEPFTCFCGEPGESVHVYPDHIMVCCKDHRPQIGL